MEQQVSRLKAQILALVAWADGSFDDAEREIFVKLLDDSPIDEDTRIELVDFIDHPPDRNEVLEQLPAMPIEVATSLLKVAYITAYADGHLHDEERGLIEAMVDRLDLSTEERARLGETLDEYRRSYAMGQELIKTGSRLLGETCLTGNSATTHRKCHDVHHDESSHLR